MKHFDRSNLVALALAFVLLSASFAGGVLYAGSAAAEMNAPLTDPSPAIKVYQDAANSVVGVSSYTQQWTREYGQQDTLYSQGSGVAIAEGGYILTNYHVIDNCTSFKVLMPDGTYAPAHLVGGDSSTDLAVLQLDERQDELVPVTPGTTANLLVGSTVIAIGNPGGEDLANTVTQGIVSALERSSVKPSNTSRSIKYVQHDASISSGNSGGGLFDINGNLVGINTLKMSSNGLSTASYEGLGFAIPIDTAYPIAMDLIEYGEVKRPQLGITATSIVGPDDPLVDYAPSSVIVASLVEDGPAQAAGLKPYDCITAVDGVKVTDMMELTTELDQHADGDVVKLTVVRYADPARVYNISSLFASGYGMNGSNQYSQQQGGSIFGRGYSSGISNAFETIEIEVTLKVSVND
ncbi:MAG: trypsin-like peptidase domain-containing protein [Eubacteriales bacterium]|nr:trypsin-like peptidase domain-containing protein [Eubacteriales bacterium]